MMIVDEKEEDGVWMFCFCFSYIFGFVCLFVCYADVLMPLWGMNIVHLFQFGWSSPKMEAF